MFSCSVISVYCTFTSCNHDAHIAGIKAKSTHTHTQANIQMINASAVSLHVGL